MLSGRKATRHYVPPNLVYNDIGYFVILDENGDSAKEVIPYRDENEFRRIWTLAKKPHKPEFLYPIFQIEQLASSEKDTVHLVIE